MEKKDIINRRIDILLNAKNNLWIATITSVTGTASLVFNFHSKLNIILFVLGVITSIIFINGYFKKDDEIEILMNKSKEESK